MPAPKFGRSDATGQSPGKARRSRPDRLGPYLESGPVASAAFMENVEDLSVPGRER
jgi:hypothetical protein